MTPREVYVLLAEWCVAPLLWPYRFCRRWYLRLRLRRKMRALGMIPCVSVLWAGAEVERVGAQVQAQSGDSLVGTVLARTVIGPWSGGEVRVYCLTWVSEIPSRPHVLVVIDATPADTSVHPICPNPDGGFYPLWIDGPTCPPGTASPFAERDFIIVRCAADNMARYRRKTYQSKAEQ